MSAYEYLCRRLGGWSEALRRAAELTKPTPTVTSVDVDTTPTDLSPRDRSGAHLETVAA